MQRLEEEKLTQEMEEEALEEEYTIQPMDDESGTPEEPPLTSGHLPFEEIRSHLHQPIEPWMYAA